MDTTPTLPALGSKRLSQGIRFPLTAYCDVHDLLAVVLDDCSIDVFRIANAQVAFTIKRKDDECNVTALHWKPDGAFLVVAWDDGTYVLHSGENGRLISQANIRAEDRQDDWRLDLRPDFGPDDDESNNTSVACFGWAIQDGRYAQGEPPNPSLSTEDWYDGEEIDDTGQPDHIHPHWKKESKQPSIADLTRSIATLDVTKVLPRLSAIPAHQMPFPKAGPGGNKFASQTVTDGIFQPPKDVHSQLVQSLFVCQDDGSIQVLLDETVKIGSCHIGGRPLAHLSHPQNSTHVILSETSSADIRVCSIDMPLSTLSGPLLHVISTNTKRIQTLLDYIAHSVRCIEHDYTTGQQLPARLLNSLNEMLAEKDGGTAIYSLYHLAMTGDFHPAMLEWLTDIVKETNHKRWDQAVGTLYTNIHNHIFMNVLPAIDRLSIAIVTLRSHAQYHEGTDEFDVPPNLFTEMLDTVDCMRIVAQKMQLIVMTEHKQFRTFSKWLRIHIEIGAAEPFSRSAIETEERELPSIDYSLLIAYIRDTMAKSRLSPHILPRPGMSGSVNQADFLKTPIISDLSYEHSLSALRLLNDRKPLEMKDVNDPTSLLNLPSITAALIGRARIVLERTTAWQSRMIPAPVTLPISISSTNIADATSTPDRTIILVLSTDSSVESLSTITISAATPSPAFSEVTLGLLDDDSRILDAKFHSLNPPTLLVLVQRSDHTALLTHSLESEVTDVQHTFPLSKFVPEKLIVGGRRGKRACVVFGQAGREWRAFALGSPHVVADDRLNSTLNGKSNGKLNGKQPILQTTEEEWEDDDEMMDDSFL